MILVLFIRRAKRYFFMWAKFFGTPNITNIKSSLIFESVNKLDYSVGGAGGQDGQTGGRRR